MLSLKLTKNQPRHAMCLINTRRVFVAANANVVRSMKTSSMLWMAADITITEKACMEVGLEKSRRGRELDKHKRGQKGEAKMKI